MFSTTFRLKRLNHYGTDFIVYIIINMQISFYNINILTVGKIERNTHYILRPKKSSQFLLLFCQCLFFFIGKLPNLTQTDARNGAFPSCIQCNQLFSIHLKMLYKKKTKVESRLKNKNRKNREYVQWCIQVFLMHVI